MFEVVATVESSVGTENLVALLSVCSVCTRGGGAKFRFIFPKNSWDFQNTAPTHSQCCI